MVKGRGSKAKGDKYERELSAYINDKTGLESFRAPLSGGGKVGLAGGADILGTPELFIEAKRVERLNFHDAMRQAEANVEKTRSQSAPIVINRKSRMSTGDSLCLMRLDDFLKFYIAYLRLEGLTKK
jgi:Holliday junction resolvase